MEHQDLAVRQVPADKVEHLQVELVERVDFQARLEPVVSVERQAQAVNRVRLQVVLQALVVSVELPAQVEHKV